MLAFSSKLCLAALFLCKVVNLVESGNSYVPVVGDLGEEERKRKEKIKKLTEECELECAILDEPSQQCVVDCVKDRFRRRRERMLLWQSSRRELSSYDTAVLMKDECNNAAYDVAIYVDKHVFVAGIPKIKKDSCPFLVMEASDPEWTEDGVPQGLQKHIHEVSFPSLIDPKKHFDILPLGTFPLWELLQAYDEASVAPVEDAETKQGEVVTSDDPSSNYDIVLANCGDFVAQVVTNLGVQFNPSMTNYIARRLLDTYDDIADKVRSNRNVLALIENSDTNEKSFSDEELIRRLVERRVRHLYADDEKDAEEPQESGGMPCGKWYSKDCIGDTDIRYASDASDNLGDQADLWTVLPGYYEADCFGIGPTGEKIPPSFAKETDFYTEKTLPYSFDSFKMFLNITVEGSRYFEHAYQVFPPAPEEFCNETVPDGAANVILPGECGLNGITLGSDRYGTSSYERDGSLVTLPFGGLWFDPERTIESFVTTPVNEKTGFTSFGAGGLLYQYAVACFDASCSGLSMVTEIFDIANPDEAILIETIRRTARRIESAQEFVARINQVYEDFNVLPEQQLPAPMTSRSSSLAIQDGCLSGICPNEDVWCEYDPACSISPYQEPAGSLRPGIYVVTVLVVLAFASMVFMYAAARLVRKREHALKEKFAVRIAETIKVEGEDRVLTAENIAEEFKKIDVDGSGMVNKAELFEFIQTGKAGKKISESDFESLFAAIDLDKNGEIDFGEFVSFFQKCQDQYEEVKDQPNVRENRESYALRDMK